nr:reverse transcriptase domain-containing protein [Tanacetum cinerariifolium]
ADCLKIIESKSKVHQTRAKAVVAKVSLNSSTPAVSPDVAELKDMVNQPLAYQALAYQAPASQTQGSGTLPGDTVTNPKEDLKGITTRSGVAYQGPTTPTPFKVAKQGTEVTKDQVQTLNPQSTAPVQPTVA